LQNSNLLGSQSFHFLADPETLEKQVHSLLLLRQGQGQKLRPLIVWEPAPLDCKRAQFEQHLQACKIVDIFSPNHLELTALVKGDDVELQPFSQDIIEQYATIFGESGIGNQIKGLAVIRCAEHGCLILSRDQKATWLPPFYDAQSSRLKDATGAGNAFLGAFTVGWLETKDSREPAIMGSVAASFAIEQTGLPAYAPATWFSGEMWNNTSTLSRIEEFKRKLSDS
jgi:sugar/nucleoside kinase (ribokinase family)